MMKRFRNCLIGLIAFGLSIVSFSYGLDYTNGFITGLENQHGITNSGYLCFYVDGGNNWGTNGSLNLGYDCGEGYCNSWGYFSFTTFKSCIIIEGGEIINIGQDNPSQGTLYYGFFPFYQECESNEPYTSVECQTEYNLMPIDSCNSEYCELNNLCGTGDCGFTGNWSSLYINDIQHIGAGIINIMIPEEFDWDYVYTGNGEQFDLDVKGYNVDSEYIDGIIRKQTTLPNNIDFNNTISGLIPLIIPGLVIIACLYFIFRFIKKIF